MATINFLPVCSHCHQVLWGETVDVIREKELIDKSKIMAMMSTNIYIEEKVGRPVWTHELADPKVLEEIRKKIRPEFIALCGKD